MQLISPQIVAVKYGDGIMVAHYTQRVGEILNANEEDRRHSDENWQRADEDIKKVGRVPKTLMMLWEQMGITSDDKLLLQALERNPEYKTTEKQIAEKGRQIYV